MDEDHTHEENTAVQTFTELERGLTTLILSNIKDQLRVGQFPIVAVGQTSSVANTTSMMA